MTNRFVFEKTSVAENSAQPFPDVPGLLVTNLTVPETLNSIERKFVCVLVLTVNRPSGKEPAGRLIQPQTVLTRSLEATLIVVKAGKTSI